MNLFQLVSTQPIESADGTLDGATVQLFKVTCPEWTAHLASDLARNGNEFREFICRNHDMWMNGLPRKGLKSSAFYFKVLNV